ncbi:cell division protein FtsX [Aquirufa sp. ROCK-SH2]
MKYSKTRPASLSFLLIFSISILGFIICLFSQIVVGLKDFSFDVKSQMKMYVYMEDSLGTNELLQTKMLLKSKKYVDYSNKENPGVEFVSKNKIAEDFLTSSHENYQDLLGDENPFKNMFILDITEEYKNSDSFLRISKDLSTLNGVYEVTYPTSYLNLLIDKIKSITYIIVIVSFLLILFIYFQISNYIKLAIHANRVLIKTMQLLGSTNSFIQKPYILKSLQLGLLGSIIGYGLSNLLFFLLKNNFPSLQFDFYNIDNQLIIVGVTSLTCLLFCFLSTIISLNKYLSIQQSNLH